MGCRENIDRLNTVPNEKTMEVYLALITKLEKTPGYLGAVLQDVVYRVALSHIGGAIIRNPEQSSEMERLLAMLPTSPWQTAGIEQILAESLGGSTFQTWPQDNQFLSRFDKLLVPKGPEGSFYSQAGTSQLINLMDGKRQDIRGLLYRFAQTSWMRNYALPGALSYVKHGGKWSDLDGRSPSSRLSEIMDSDNTRFTFPMLGINALGVGDLIYLRDSFTPDTRGSEFLLTAFANYE